MGFLDDIAVLRFDVANIRAGSQVIVRFAVDKATDPLFEVEYCGKRASVHLSDLDPNFIGKWRNDGNKNVASTAH
jgi:hypothetical protein